MRIEECDHANPFEVYGPALTSCFFNRIDEDHAPRNLLGFLEQQLPCVKRVLCCYWWREAWKLDPTPDAKGEQSSPFFFRAWFSGLLSCSLARDQSWPQTRLGSLPLTNRETRLSPQLAVPEEVDSAGENARQHTAQNASNRHRSGQAPCDPGHPQKKI